MKIDEQLWLDAYRAELQRNPDINASAQYADAAVHEYRTRFCVALPIYPTDRERKIIGDAIAQLAVEKLQEVGR